MKIPRRLQSWSFQSTLPRRERHLAFRVRDCLLMFQSTLPRRERLSSLQVSELPAVFQSTLPRRERRTPHSSTSARNGFNPRSHEGSDCSMCGFGIHMEVSIHAPTKGATMNLCKVQNSIFVSIHAPTKGATRAAFQLR